MFNMKKYSLFLGAVLASYPAEEVQDSRNSLARQLSNDILPQTLGILEQSQAAASQTRQVIVNLQQQEKIPLSEICFNVLVQSPYQGLKSITTDISKRNYKNLALKAMGVTTAAAATLGLWHIISPVPSSFIRTEDVLERAVKHIITPSFFGYSRGFWGSCIGVCIVGVGSQIKKAREDYYKNTTTIAAGFDAVLSQNDYLSVRIERLEQAVIAQGLLTQAQIDSLGEHMDRRFDTTEEKLDTSIDLSQQAAKNSEIAAIESRFTADTLRGMMGVRELGIRRPSTNNASLNHFQVAISQPIIQQSSLNNRVPAIEQNNTNVNSENLATQLGSALLNVANFAFNPNITR